MVTALLSIAIGAARVFLRVAVWLFAIKCVAKGVNLMNIRVVAFGAVLIVNVAHAQTFKGHRIGESAADFLKVEPAIQAKLADCKANAPRELTVDELKAELGRKGYENYVKQEAQYNAEGKHMRHLTQDPDVYGFKCDPLLSALVRGSGGFDENGFDIRGSYTRNLEHRAISEHNMSLYPHIPRCDRSFEFHDGTLVRISIQMDALYEDIRSDMTARLGTQPTELHVPFHNAFGAQWNEDMSEWDTQTIYAKLSQDHNPAKASAASLDVWSAEWRRAVIARLPSKPKPLD